MSEGLPFLPLAWKQHPGSLVRDILGEDGGFFPHHAVLGDGISVPLFLPSHTLEPSSLPPHTHPHLLHRVFGKLMRSRS